MNAQTPPRRPRGRPLGSTTGLRPGSRPWQLSKMATGDRLLYEVPAGRTVTGYMGQIGADIGRADMRAHLAQSHALLVIPGKREVIDVVIVERLN